MAITVISSNLKVNKVYIILPSYNESASLTRLIPRIFESFRSSPLKFEIVLVNDGSTDGISQVLYSMHSRYPTRELIHQTNTGYGSALKTGIAWVLDHASNNDAIVTMDADNTQNPIYIPHLIAKIEDGCDAVTASYVMEGGHAIGVPLMRRVMSVVVNFLFEKIIQLPGIHTYTNGFRAYRVSALKSVQNKYSSQFIVESGFPGGTEIYLKVAGLGGKLAEIPFDLHYELRGSGSKIKFFSTIQKYLKLLWRGRGYLENESPIQ